MKKENKDKIDLDNAFAAILYIYQITNKDWEEEARLAAIRTYITQYFEES